MSDYKRLTRRNNDGTSWVKCVCCDKVSTCNYTKDSCCQELQDRLAELEDLIEQNVLIKLPCKVGDTVYTVEWHTDWITERWDIYEIQVSGFCIDKGGVRPVDFYGATIYEPFFTRAEAEAKLEELKGKQ